MPQKTGREEILPSSVLQVSLVARVVLTILQLPAWNYGQRTIYSPLFHGILIDKKPARGHGTKCTGLPG